MRPSISIGKKSSEENSTKRNGRSSKFNRRKGQITPKQFAQRVSELINQAPIHKRAKHQARSLSQQIKNMRFASVCDLMMSNRSLVVNTVILNQILKNSEITLINYSSSIIFFMFLLFIMSYLKKNYEKN
mgnify:CR=1 FL=1